MPKPSFTIANAPSAHPGSVSLPFETKEDFATEAEQLGLQVEALLQRYAIHVKKEGPNADRNTAHSLLSGAFACLNDFSEVARDA